MNLFIKTILIIVSFMPLLSFGQDTLTRSGKYTEQDVYVYNPSVDKNTDTLWTAKEVYVNNHLVLSGKEIQKSAFVIPLTKMNFKTGDSITIKIVQANTESRVKILYP